VKAHGGRIEVQSATDEGTTFRLFFPSEHNHGDNTDR
jgi:signal transduction histidine kinase